MGRPVPPHPSGKERGQAVISVIVPVYNAEAYLSRCMESILNQTYRDIQVICVNDGSTDSSGDRWLAGKTPACPPPGMPGWSWRKGNT